MSMSGSDLDSLGPADPNLLGYDEEGIDSPMAPSAYSQSMQTEPDSHGICSEPSAQCDNISEPTNTDKAFGQHVMPISNLLSTAGSGHPEDKTAKIQCTWGDREEVTCKSDVCVIGHQKCRMHPNLIINCDNMTIDTLPVKSRNNRPSRCPVCEFKTPHVRRHVVTSHCPWFIDPYKACFICKVQFGQSGHLVAHLRRYPEHERFDSSREQEWVNAMLGLYGLQLLRFFEVPNLHLLLQFVVAMTEIYPSGARWDDEGKYLLSIIAAELGEDMPQDLTFNPPSSYLVVFHWRVFAALLRQLDDSQQSCIRHHETLGTIAFPCLNRTSVETGAHPALVSTSVPREINHHYCPLTDSHFHLDSLLRRVGKRKVSSLVMMICQPKPSHQAFLRFAVANYVWPLTWPKVLESGDERVLVSVGVHPRCIRDATTEKFLQLEELSTKAVAIGEIGLDYTVRDKRLAPQQRQGFRRQLAIATERNLTVVLHIRDFNTGEAYEDVLRIMKNVLGKDHRIYLHCFNESVCMVKKFLSSFTNLYVGISPLALTNRCHPEMEEVIRTVPLDRLLVENDSPYLHLTECVAGHRQCSKPPSPFGVLMVCRRVAMLRNMALSDLCQALLLNFVRCYGIDG